MIATRIEYERDADGRRTSDPPGQVRRDAAIDGPYRYALSREWGLGPTCTWVMLNPSTADANIDDPTIRRCIDFSRRWGFGALLVVNLFAYRTPRPDVLKTAAATMADVVGPGNQEAVDHAIRLSTHVVAAWGAHGTWRPPSPLRQPPDVTGLCARHGRALGALKTTAAGQPCHPLYLRADLHPAPWPRPGPSWMKGLVPLEDRVQRLL